MRIYNKYVLSQKSQYQLKWSLFTVSVTMTLAGRLSPCQLPAYLAGQLVGAALGTDNRERTGKMRERVISIMTPQRLEYDGDHA
jgi:hypothetical protein